MDILKDAGETLERRFQSVGFYLFCFASRHIRTQIRAVDNCLIRKNRAWITVARLGGLVSVTCVSLEKKKKKKFVPPSSFHASEKITTTR